MIYIGNDLVLSPCSVERRRLRILSGGCSDPGSVGSDDDDDDVIVISWVYMWVGTRTDRSSRVVWGEAQASATPPSGGISNSWGNSLFWKASRLGVAGGGPRA